MKKLIPFAVAMILLASTAFSQCVLSYQNNSLVKEDVILSKDMQYMDPGSAGLNQIWDFSKISFIGTDNTNQILSTPKATLEGVSEYNVLMNDGGREYYMYSTASGLIEKGYTSTDVTMVYSDPVLKMIYPFAYGENFTDKYVGSAMFMGTSKIDVSGDLTVTADAIGTLILPGLMLANTLRVKTEKTGIEVGPCSSNVTHILRYSWYAPGYRYPVLVIATTELRTNTKEPVITKTAVLNVQGAVNNENLTSIANPDAQAMSDIEVSVYPNPFSDIFSFHYFLREQTPVKIALFDVMGKFIRQIQQQEVQAEGIHTGTINAGNLSLNPGMYYLKFTFENKVIVKKVVKL